MKRFSNYEETKTNEFTITEKIEVGGHICKILDAKEETVTPQNGSAPYTRLALKFDMDDTDKQPGYYAKKFKTDSDKDALTAKWKGNYYISIPKDDGSENDEKIKTNFKTIITSIEKSNPGYDWEKSDWDEKTLIGKKFCGVFGLEEFESNTAGVITFTRCRFIRSTENMDNIPMPKVKLLNGTYVDYDSYTPGGKVKEQSNNSAFSSEDDLPF